MPVAATGTPATKALDRAKVPHTLLPYDHDPANTHFGEEAVRALGQDPAQVFKTLVVSCTGGPAPLVVAVVPVAQQLDLKALAAAAGAKKAALAEHSLAERTTGYIVGGISPLGQKKTLPTFIDSSAQAFGTMMVSAGRRGLQVELSPADLALITRASFATIAR
ncbi:Cys-tRNA(Pro) deacylase [Luteococcus sp. H138]|uniref:Cys-tRNA(Pro) deacylase n=1 Tax=unclassified Luteococcus TaxID=2639923 RepID=UPI00313E1B9B